MSDEPKVVSPDTFLFDEQGHYIWTPKRSAEAWRKADQLLAEELRGPEITTLVLMVGIPGSGKSTWLQHNRRPRHVYLDSTMTRRDVRARYVSMAQALQREIEAVVLLTSYRTCCRRNAARAGDRKVPEVTLERFRRQLKDQPVLHEEGFDRLNLIRSSAAAEFLARIP